MVNGALLMAPARRINGWNGACAFSERALASLEARQEKSEQMLNRGLQLLEEKLSRQDQPDLEIAAPAIAPVEPETPAQEAEMPAHDVGVAVKLLPMPAEEAKPEPPISQKEMDDFIAQARRAAQAASLPPPAKPKSLPRWVAWAAVACAVLDGDDRLGAGAMWRARRCPAARRTASRCNIPSTASSRSPIPAMHAARPAGAGLSSWRSVARRSGRGAALGPGGG